MKLAFSLLAFLSLPYCIAQTNPMEYFYEGKETLPDFAALAVLESQHCPIPIAIKNYESKEYEEYIEQICTSRYRIIKVLDAASDTLKKKYIEVKEKPMFADSKYIPYLIFGEYRNGMIQIIGYQPPGYRQNFSPFVDYFLGGMDALHSIGTPYFNLKNSGSIDTLFYNEHLEPLVKYYVEAAGKNFGELLLRLIHNRTPIKAAPIKNEFAALGAIKSIRLASGSKRANLYELNLTIENVIKNDAGMGPNIAIFIDRDRLPPVWDCHPLDYYSNDKTVFYLLGDLKNGSLFIDSLVSPQDAFVFGDTIYDISMGLPYEELIAYFFPPNISLEEFKCQRNASTGMPAKWKDFFDNRSKKETGKWKGPFIENFLPWYPGSVRSPFRCRRYDPCVMPGPSGCHRYYSEGERAVWGSISIKNKEGTGKIKTDKFKIGNKIKSRRGDLRLKYAAGDVRTTACKVKLGEEMTIVEELEYYVLVKASCGQGWLGKADVEEFSESTYDPYDRFRRFESGEIFAPGPCMPL